MANSRVALVQSVKTKDGWRRYQVEVERKGRGLKQKVIHPAGVRIIEIGEYQIRWYEGSKPKYKSVGRVLADAVTLRDNQISNLAAERAADAAGRKLEVITGRKHLASARDEFIARKQMMRRRGGVPLDKETVDSYRNSINEYLAVTKHRYADQVTDLSLLQFFDALRKRGLEERTVQNNWQYLRTFLKFCDLDPNKMLKKDTGEDNRPRALEKQPEAYTRDQMAKFLAACKTERDRLAFECYLKMGLREKELTYAEFSDINFDECFILIHNKPELGFRTKTGKSREITIESELLSKLKDWRKKNTGKNLIFGTTNETPNGHFLEACKRTAKRAGLFCGACKSCKRKDSKWDSCDRWYLHKFRATFATWALQSGVDIRTVQALMGHAKIEQTAKYIAPARGRAAQERLNAVFSGL
jgi:integrase